MIPSSQPGAAPFFYRQHTRTSLDHLFEGVIRSPSMIDVQVGDEPLSLNALARLSGCPAGGTISVDADDEAVFLTVRHEKWITNARSNRNFVEIRSDDDGYYLYLDYIWFSDDCPKGSGAVALLRMALEAKRLGFTRIDLLAAGGTGIKSGKWTEKFWGFELWPRLGFDTLLQPAILALTEKIPHLSHIKKVSELIAVDLDWWKINGDGWEMSFDLTAGSASWDTLHHFISERGLLL